MEDVRHQHELPYDPRRPKVNFDERPCQLIGDVVQPIPMAPRLRDFLQFFLQLRGIGVI